MEVQTGHVGAMLVPCWHIFRSQARLGPLLARLGRFFVASWLFFRVLGRSRLDFGGSGEDFGGSEALFFIGFSHQ